jgi:NAD(P)-dependent dehydrogenase (short-subunit alcohol dehydrogenase family)
MDLNGKTIVVTGAASGIGAATAAVMLELGATVIGLDRNTTTDTPYTVLPLDLADAASISAAASGLPEKIDALCNVAGLALPHPAENIIAVNLVGTRLFTEQVLDRLTPGSAIVNVASTASRAWRANIDETRPLLAIDSLAAVPGVCAELQIEHQQSYRMSKEAVVIWTVALAGLLTERDIRVNAVSPGATETPMFRYSYEAAGERARITRELSPRIAEPRDLAHAIAFLCSDLSRAITGVNLPVDNGMIAAVDRRDYAIEM